MRKQRRLLADGEELNVWPSLADVTSTIALVLFVLVLLAYIKNLVSGRRLEAYQLQIAASEQRLSALQQRLTRTSGRLEAGQRALELSQAQLKAQELVVATSNLELKTLRAQLEGIALLRVGVLDKVKQSIEAQLPARAEGAPPPVTIGDNGNIVINEGLVFEYNSYELKEEGQRLLQTLAVALLNVLQDDSVRENIDTVQVQGHTDNRGSSAFNRDLSAKRAAAVLSYLFQVQPELEQSYGGHFAASAFSEFRPLSAEDNETAWAKNRRIEVSVVLRDANVRQVIDDYTASIHSQLTPGQDAPSDPEASSGPTALPPPSDRTDPPPPQPLDPP